MSDEDARTLIDEAMADVQIVVCQKCSGEGVLRHALGHQCPTCEGRGKIVEGPMGSRHYPEHEKLQAVKDRSQAVGEFLDASNYTLCEWVEETDDEPGGFYPVRQSLQRILAIYYGIDLDVIEEEKRAMLAEARGEEPS